MKKSLRVLSIEDHEPDTQLLAIELQRGGFDLTIRRVETRADLDEALNQGQWDLVLADHHLPGFDSLSALSLVMEKGLDIPFILVSGAITDETAIKALRMGAHDFISKDNLSRLVPSIEREIREAVVRKKLKEEEKVRRESDVKFRKIFDHSNDAIFVSDPKLDKILEVNPRACKMLGFTREELLSKHLSEIYPDEACEYKAFSESVLKKGEETTRKLTCRTKDGRSIPAEISASVMDHDERCLIIAVVRDITKQMEAEEFYRTTTTVFNNATEAIMVTDADNNILSVNPAFTHVTGHSAKEIIGKNPRIFKSGRHNKAFYDEMWNAIRSTGHWEGDIWDKRKNGEVYPKWLSITSVKDKEGNVTQYTALFTDITKIKQGEEKLQFQASHDTLTGLPNRSLAFERLSQVVKRTRRKGKAALFLVDLDRFKQVNDSFGHVVGDMTLQQVGTRLRFCVRETDTVARIGGDEFLIVLSDIDRQGSIDVLAEKIVEEISVPFVIEGREICLSASIGITIIPDDGNEGLTLIKNADMAMYKAKTRGGNRYRFFSEEMEKSAKKRTHMEWGLRQALKNQELVLHYQPVLDLKSKKTIALEALVRWNHPENGLLSPEQFISIAEESHLIVQVGEWVLNLACKQAKTWQDRFGFQGQINVNVSTRQIIYNDFHSVLVGALVKSGLPPECLTLEVTESLMLDPTEDSIRKLKNLKDVGVKIAIDDFGTGYSSLSYLWRYPIDYLKIDRSFIANIISDKKRQDLVGAIVRMGQSMKMIVVAEGVETPEDLSFLVDLGCDAAQGYYFSKPVSADAYEKILNKQEKDSQPD